MPHGASARLFVALDPPPQARDALAAWARSAAAALVAGAVQRGGAPRLLDPAQLHLTLCFLGSRPVAEIEPLAAALAACTWEPGELWLGAPLLLPPRRPGTLAVAVRSPDGRLERFQQSVTAALARASGWQPERRGYRAHITVARLPGGGRSARGIRAAQPPSGPLPPTPALSFTAVSATLYRSFLEPSGAVHEPLAVLGATEAYSGNPPWPSGSQ
jgi:2'-5' RNA ligase